MGTSVGQKLRRNLILSSLFAGSASSAHYVCMCVCVCGGEQRVRRVRGEREREGEEKGGRRKVSGDRSSFSLCSHPRSLFCPSRQYARNYVDRLAFRCAAMDIAEESDEQGRLRRGEERRSETLAETEKKQRQPTKRKERKRKTRVWANACMHKSVISTVPQVSTEGSK